MKKVLMLVLCMGCLSTNVLAETITEKVNVEKGASLIELAMAGTRYQGSGFGKPSPKNREAFLIYQILGKYEGTVAWFAVNQWTGDVWDMDECKLIINPSLQKAQAAIRKQFTGTELKEYQRLHALKPYRMYNLEPCL